MGCEDGDGNSSLAAGELLLREGRGEDDAGLGSEEVAGGAVML